MGNYTMFGRFENPRRGMQARNLTTIVPKILELKSSSEQIFSKNCRWVPLLLSVNGSWQCLVMFTYSILYYILSLIHE